ncbi:hypothetical protein HPB49_008436 [Dermacentor silvarum]|uniref:Uncharacterized protein n=1 Tax=Dermacentor silvarum TaxID=543639 RepID=A0ACB8CE09_DERSI|nr:hypothetical protein HPB49_008436 [Dermacentor silvarum]
MRTGTKEEDVRWDHAKKFVAIMGALFVASFVLVLGALSILGRTRGASPRRLCLTDDCSAHRSLLSVFLNSSVDPCQDFDAYVCPQSGASFTEAPAVGITRSTLSLMRWRWLNGLRKLLERGKERLLVGGRKALFMYTSCIAQEKEASTRDAVTLFMDRLNLRRPIEPTHNGHAFGVLLDLAFNWNAPLWFQVSLLPRDAYHPRRRLLVSPNPLMAEWQETLAGLRSVRDYRERWSERQGLLPNDSVVARSYGMTVNIFRTFLNHSADGAPWQFFLEDASKYVTFSEDMALLLNEHIRPKQKFSERDVMVFEETGLLKAVNLCFALYDDSELLDHIHWLFAETYGSIADPYRLSVSLRGDDSQRAKRRPYYCAAAVEASYQLLVNALFAVTRFTPRERKFLVDLLSKVNEEAVNLLRHADWFDWRTKSKALAKFERIRTVLWPREDLLKDAGIAGVYDDFPDYASSFGAFWVDTRRAMSNFQAEHGSSAGIELTSAPSSYVLPLVRYTHVLNTAFVSMGALGRPLYYSSGTRAMMYGGLGYQYAQQIVRALDSFGVTVDEHGDRVESWLSPTSAVGFDKRVSCLGSADGDIFPEVPALEVAYATYVRAAAEVKGEPSLFVNVSEAQIFFITMCIAMCRLPKARNCNKAVMAFRPFADAFGCKPGAKMNRPQKCSFFE